MDTKKDLHPELREGEVFLGNFIPSDYKNTWQFKYIASFRLGRVAYDMFGKQRPSLRPAFAEKEEFLATSRRMGRIFPE